MSKMWSILGLLIINTASAQVLYDLTFSPPVHLLGQPAAIGSGGARFSVLNFGTSRVAADILGHDRSVLFIPQNTGSLQYSQYELALSSSPSSQYLRVTFDVFVESMSPPALETFSPGPDDALTLLFDTPSVVRLDFIGRDQILDFQGNILGTFQKGTWFSMMVDVDLVHNQWRVQKNGVLLFAGQFFPPYPASPNPPTAVYDLRLNLSDNASDPLVPKVYLDNLVVESIPPGFDVDAYLARYPDVAAAYGSDHFGAWIYYRDHGIYQGEVFDELFRVEEYLSLYPEMAALFGENLGAALLHWLTEGRIEGRLGRLPAEFSAAGYFTRNPDVAAAVNHDPRLAWSHYWLYGIYEGRAYDDELRVFEYLAINADLTAAFVNDWRQATLHWMRYGRTEGRLGRLPVNFNVAEYLNRNPDVAIAWGTNPTTDFLHFWLYGINEGRTFDDLFRVDEYLALNPDLAAIFGANRRSAFKHWVRYGQAEGRRGKNP